MLIFIVTSYNYNIKIKIPFVAFKFKKKKIVINNNHQAAKNDRLEIPQHSVRRTH
jgi:hypothetical protein